MSSLDVDGVTSIVHTEVSGGDQIAVSLAEVPPDRLSPLHIAGAYLLGAGCVNGDRHADLATAERGELDHHVSVVFCGPRTASALNAVRGRGRLRLSTPASGS